MRLFDFVLLALGTTALAPWVGVHPWPADVAVVAAFWLLVLACRLALNADERRAPTYRRRNDHG